MGFNFVEFIKKYRIPYRESGKNIHRGNIGIRCPFCGPSDPDMHMGIGVDSGYWHCWRDPSHRGKRPERLIVALIRCTWEEAHTLAQEGLLSIGYEALKERAALLFCKASEKRDALSHQIYPEDIVRLNPDGGVPQSPRRLKFWEYIVSRRFPAADVEGVVERYRLRCALTGEQAWRLIFPFFVDGKKVGWTGRSIIQTEELRYRSFPNSSGVKQLVYNYDNAAGGGKVLTIVEGPVDTVKVDYYGHPEGIHAVGVLGTSITPKQVSLLLDLAYRYDEVIILLDADAGRVAMQYQSMLALVRPKVRFLPLGRKDPGLLFPQEVVPAVLGRPLK